MLGIILLVVGIIGLVKGKISVTKNRELRRPASIFVCLLFIAPFPLQFLAGLFLGVQAVAEGRQNVDHLKDQAWMLELGILGVCFLVGMILAFVLAKPKIPDAPRSRRDYDNEEDDRPRRRRPVADDLDDEEDDRPRRRRPDDDDRPRRRDDLDERAR